MTPQRLQDSGECGTAGNFPFALAALPFLPYAWSSAADVLACDGVSCRESARVLDLPAASTFVFANGLVWAQYVLAPVEREVERATLSAAIMLGPCRESAGRDAALGD